MSVPLSPNVMPLSGGGMIQGPVHGYPRSPLHIDVYQSGTKYHVPYEGQTTLDMFTKSSNLTDQLRRISDYNLGTFRADKSY
jgi:hypothetical protein